MNDLLKSLTAFGMEGMNADVEVIDTYAGSEVAEELIELDNIEAQTVAMESMSDAIMEGALEMQTLALEAAGLDLGTASQFTGELSTESVANMAKRGYYEVKIQVKKVIQKIWKLILSVVDNFMGSEGRLKSYGKLFKKYSERLSKINPKEGKDGEEREVTIRDWQAAGIVGQLQQFKALVSGGDWIKRATALVKASNPKECIESLCDVVRGMRLGAFKVLRFTGKSTREAYSDTSRITIPAIINRANMEQLEKDAEEFLKDMDMKDQLTDIIENIKEVDTTDIAILTAKSQLGSIGRSLEDECRRDLKFKKELIKLRKSWDKKTGNWNLDNLAVPQGVDEQDFKDGCAALLRTLNKFSPVITGVRMAFSKIYSAIASNLQGVLADMAKVIAKGTNIGR